MSALEKTQVHEIISGHPSGVEETESWAGGEGRGEADSECSGKASWKW